MPEDQIIHPHGIPGPSPYFGPVPQPPRIMLRMMMYVKGEGLPQFPNLKEFGFEPHPFSPKNITPEVYTVVRKFLEEEIERLDRALGMLS